jgi:hypothetical protein
MKMTKKLILLVIQVILITSNGYGDDLKNAILDVEPGSESDYLKFRDITLSFEVKTIGKPKDFHIKNEDRINRIFYPKGGRSKISFVNRDVVGRFTYHHIPNKTSFESISFVKSIKDLELILGKPTYRSEQQAEWGFFSSDGKGHYLFEFYVASFDKESSHIIGIRHGVAPWPER